MIKWFLFSLFWTAFVSWSQVISYPNHRCDVVEYRLNITFGNALNEPILVNEKIMISDWENRDTLVFDLQAQRTLHGKGMRVESVNSNKGQLNFIQTAQELLITGFQSNELYKEVEINYSGSPEDGLVIGSNRFSQPTAFGDNWPNRAHQWFACNDYPSDKALIQYVVNVPKQFDVIANGLKIRVTEKDDRKEFEYRTNYVLPTKVMVIGVADFSIKNYGASDGGIQVSAYVYPENEKEGFYDMQLALDILNWFENKIGEYPFDKLANVQSTTRFGGMENASCIFYDEKAVDGKRTMETLLVHEIAHQWFGNSASEMDFSHLWLSEGFATYLTNYYILEVKGEEAFYKQLEKDKAKIIALKNRDPRPVIDESNDLMSLLNANSYQKGGWVLHMLNNELGDAVFWKGVRNYYDQFTFSNARTRDFIEIMETVSGKELDQFFEQWLTQTGMPKLKVKNKVRGKNIGFKVEDRSGQRYFFDIEFEVELVDGTKSIEKVHMDKPLTVLRKTYESEVKKVTMDSRHKLLFEKY
jgi:aminopeptidase N